MPEAITKRLVRFHLVNNVHGEPPHWTRDGAREAQIWLSVTDTGWGELWSERSFSFLTLGLG